MLTIPKCSHSRVVSNCNYCKITKSQMIYTNIDKKDIEWVECVICGMRSKDLSNHYNKVHKLNMKDRHDLGIVDIVCEEKRNKAKGEKNPAYKHGGKFSPFSPNFIKYDSHDDYIKNIKDITSKCKMTKNTNSSNNTTVEFYIKKYNVDRDTATTLLQKRQSLLKPRPSSLFTKNTLYIFKFVHNGSEYTKIGVTNDFSSRYSSLELYKNNVTDLIIFENKNINMVNVEYLIKRNFNNVLSHEERHGSFGYTEVFIEYNKIKSFIEKTISEFHKLNSR